MEERKGGRLERGKEAREYVERRKVENTWIGRWMNGQLDE